MADVGEIRARLVLSNEEFKRKMNETRDDLKKTSFSAEQLNRDFGAVQKGSLAVGTAVAAAIGGSVKVAANFEQSMAKVKAISGATDEEFARLEKTARDMGASTIFSASQAADGLSYLAMAGFSVNKQIAALPAVLNAAIAGNIDLASSADMVSNIMTGFGLTAEDTGKAVDVLVMSMTTANTDLPMLADGMKYVAPVAAGLGWSIEETAAAIGKLSDAGIQGGQAGTTLRAALLSLANPTGQTEKAIKRLNIEVLDANGQMKSLPELIGHVSSKMEGMTDAQKTQTAAQLVGREAAAGFIALLDVGQDTLADYVTQLENSAGKAQEMADVQGATLVGAFKEFQSAVEEVGIKLGNEFLPMFTDIVRWGAKVVSSIDEINIGQAKSALAFAGTAAAIGLTISTIGKLVLAARSLMVSMGPAGWLITGLSIIGGLIAANNVNTEEAVEVNLDHARSLKEQSDSIDEQISRYEALREKNQLTNEELARFVDLQSRIALETDATKIEQMQKEYGELLKKSGLSNKEMDAFLQLNDEIIEKVPNSNLILTEQGNVLLDNTDAAKAYNEQLLKELELELRKQAAAASSNLAENIKKHTEALKEQNGLAEQYLKKQEEIEVQKMRIATEEVKLNSAILRQDEAAIKLAEEQVEKEQSILGRLEDQAYELSGQIIAQEEIVNGIELEIKKGQEAYQELINYRLEQVSVVAEKGKEVDEINNAIEKTKKLREEAVQKHTVDGKITDEGQKQIRKYDEQIKKLDQTKREVNKLKEEQDKVTSSLDDSLGVAQDLTYEMSRDVEKHLTQTGYKKSDAETLHSILVKPAVKQISIWEKVTRSFTEKHHSGGIVGSDTAEKLPKFHSGGIPAQTIRRLQDMPLHNEIDARLLKNEMVLTESQQANLFKMIDLGNQTTDDTLLRELLAATLNQNQILSELLNKETSAIVEFEPLYQRVKSKMNEDKYSRSKQRRRQT